MEHRNTAERVRPAAVAGMFYPAAPADLRRQVEQHLVASVTAAPRPKALVVPHAGLAYSGVVAGAAYALLRDTAGPIRRVVLIGPSHRVALRGIAVPSASGFATPLGEVPVDREGRRRLLDAGLAVTSDPAHAREHSLEVQLPFLQAVLGGFTLLPLVAGDADPAAVAAALEHAWGGEETLLVVSTDLSHFHDYDTARAVDAAACRRILALEGGLDGEDACGCVGLNGFLLAARRRGLVPRLLDQRNSGDTAGDRRSVVGYAAFAFHEPR